ERRRLEIAREQTVEQASMDKAIALYQKSLDESAAAVDAENAKARAMEAAEKAKTVAQTETANREKTLETIAAEKDAERMRLIAEGDKVRKAVEAEAARLINEAENVLTDEARHSLFRRKMLEHVEGIISASAKPLENVSDIKIMQLGGSGTQGLDWSGGGGASGGGSGDGPSPTDEVMNSALRYRVQAPFVDSLMKDIGIDGKDMGKSDIFRNASDMTRATSEIARAEAAKKKSADDSKDGK
ncbi:MAG: flotillin domain-containing protein, partial [Roseobacter sp.]